LRLSDLAATSEILDLAAVPFHPQESHHCGPASLLTLLEASGVDVGYDSVVERVYVPGLEGSLQLEMLAAARVFGRIPYLVPPEPESLVAELAARRPVLVLLNLGLPRRPVWHYAVVVGIDVQRNRVLLRSGPSELDRQKASRWMRRWEWAGRWGMVLLAPGEWPARPEREPLLRALASFEEVADPAAAERAWTAAAEHWPEEPIAWLGLANAAYRRGDLAEAGNRYRRTLAIDPGHLPARINLALALDESGRACEGVEVLDPLVPADHPMQARLAGIAEELRRACGED
jgi:hypothetical protein